MQRATYRSPLALLSAAALAVLMLTAFWAHAAQQSKALNEKEVLELLAGGVPSARVSEIVDDRGIDFDFTPEIEQKVRDAGGADDVVAALRKASQRHAESDQPRTGGLIIKTIPGGTQIYLNDEPKGITSPEGEIRLPDLAPGTYTLRVSMLGYQSYEKPMTVAAGEEPTIYVTLLQQPAVLSPKGNPATKPVSSQQVTAPLIGIPVPGVKVSALKFYEGPHDKTPAVSERVYRYSFDRASTRSIFWELDLSFPSPPQRIDFSLDAVWYKPDGSEMTKQSQPVHVEPAWPGSLHSLGYGWVQAGNWAPGTYRVDLFCQGTRIASKSFQIN